MIDFELKKQNKTTSPPLIHDQVQSTYYARFLFPIGAQSLSNAHALCLNS